MRTSTAQRAGAVRAADVERTRIERDLHDGVQPRLVSVGMTLGMAQQKIDTDPAAAKALIAEAHTSTKAAITELRQLARGIHASVLDDRGLDAALSALGGRSPVPVALDVRLDGRPSTGAGSRWKEAEAAVYFTIAESLTNAAKHSRAERVPGGRARARRRDALGAGGGQRRRRRDRRRPAAASTGSATACSPPAARSAWTARPGGPTSLEVSVPCAS